MSKEKVLNILNKKEQKKLLTIFNERYPTSLRNKTMVRLMLKSGLKLSETINLKWNSFDFYSDKLSVKKDDLDRNLFLGDKTIKQVKKWRKKQEEIFVEKEITDENDIVFTTLTGNQLSKSNVRSMIYNYADKAGIQEEVTRYYRDDSGNILDETYKAKKVTPNTLRHTFAFELYKLTNDIKIVQEKLGHKSIHSTKIYTDLVNDNRKKQMRFLD